MFWINRKKSAKEIARRVGEKVARWEREAQEARNRIIASGTSPDLGWTGTIEECGTAPEIGALRVNPAAPSKEYPNRSQSIPAGSTKAEPTEAKPTQAKPTKAEPNPTGPNRTEPSTAEPDLAHLSTAGYLLLLTAGDAMSGFLLEERSESNPPGWCLMCGKRGPDMTNSLYHSLDCAVGLWLAAKPK